MGNESHLIGFITSRSRIRKSPSYLSGTVRNFNRNLEVIILETRGGWSQIQRRKITGWIRTSRLRMVDVPAFVNVSNAEIRAEPNSHADLVTRISQNEHLKITGRFGGWFQVSTGRENGWIFKCDVRVLNPHAVTKRSIILRKEKRSSPLQTRQLKHNTPVLILAESEKWTYVQQGSQIGWVRTADIIKT